jgi:SpoVK/Ycf46/Vps4 family AAA+-type ATPase
VEVARLGLLSEKKQLRSFLEKIAVEEINKNHHEVYNALLGLLESDERVYKSSGLDSTETNNQDFDLESFWLSSTLERKIGRILKYLKKEGVDGGDYKLNRILLHGVPGTGKTTLGFYIAQELNLPIRYVRVTDVMSSRLGETMKNISEVFNTPKREVIFIDEFDAFAKTRSDNNDVGELKRIVNSIIQTLDFSAHNKVVIVATNLVDTIDSAILRRFPFKIEVGVLNDADKKDFFMHFIKNGKNTKATLSNLQCGFLFEVFNLLGLDTIDEIKSFVQKAKMEMIIANRKKVTYKDFIDVLLFDGYLVNLKHIKTQNKKLLSKILNEIESVGYSKQEISASLGIHRNTYPNYVSK